MIPAIGPGTLLMFAVGGLLIYLAIARKYEPTLLLPIGFGVLLATCRSRRSTSRAGCCTS